MSEVPNPHQYIMMTCPAREIMYGGEAGGGKTWALTQMAKRRTLKYPGANVIAFRRVTKDLVRTLVREAKLALPYRRNADDKVADYKEKPAHTFTVPHGDEEESVYQLMHLQNEGDEEDHLGPEYDMIIFDEASRFTEKQLVFLKSRLRSTRVPNSELRFLMGSNPLGPGHWHLLTEYVEPIEDKVMEVLWYWPIQESDAIWNDILLTYDVTIEDEREDAKKEWISRIRHENIGWRQYDEETRKTKKRVDPYDVWRAYPSPIMEEYDITEGHTRCFIPAKLEDNPHLDRDDYVAQLAPLGKRIVDAYLRGNWKITEGQYFSTFRETIHVDGRETDWHVIDPVRPKPWWPKWIGFDWGFSRESMAVALWLTWDADNEQVIVYNELAKNLTEDRELARQIVSMSGADMIDYMAVDPSMFYDRGEGPSKGDRWKNYVNFPIRGDIQRDRVQGWSAIRDLLATNPYTGKPGLVIGRNCEYLIRTLPQMQYDMRPNHEEDMDTTGEDHAVDALRYGIVSRSATADDYADDDPGLGSFDYHDEPDDDMVMDESEYEDAVEVW